MQKIKDSVRISLFLLAFGIVLVLASSTPLTGAVTGLTVAVEFLTHAGFIVIIFSLFLLLLETGTIDDFLCKVIGQSPIDSNERLTSEMYNQINEKNIDKVFQTDLSHKQGPNIKGAKAIVYLGLDGKYRVGFMTEATITHHRHAGAAMVKHIDGDYVPQECIDALYNGDPDRGGELLTRMAGYELQYDADAKKIIGIKHDSWITKRQIDRQKVLPKKMQEDMFLELLGKIDNKYLSSDINNLEEKVLTDSYSGL